MPYQMGDALGGLAFLAFALVAVILFFRLLFLAASRKPAGRTAAAFGGVIALYVILLLGASLLSKEQLIPLGSDECFDDWCASVTDVNLQGGTVTVTLRVTNEAKRIAQTPDHPRLRLLDGAGVVHAPREVGPVPLDKRLEAGESFTTQAVFDLPAGTQHAKIVLTEGSGPPIIGDQNSPLHKKAYFEF